jgi:hypothetical protein
MDPVIPCHECCKELGKNWVTVATPVCPVRVHPECREEYSKKVTMIVNAMFGLGR